MQRQSTTKNKKVATHSSPHKNDQQQVNEETNEEVWTKVTTPHQQQQSQKKHYSKTKNHNNNNKREYHSSHQHKKQHDTTTTVKSTTTTSTKNKNNDFIIKKQQPQPQQQQQHHPVKSSIVIQSSNIIIPSSTTDHPSTTFSWSNQLLSSSSTTATTTTNNYDHSDDENDENENKVEQQQESTTTTSTTLSKNQWKKMMKKQALLAQQLNKNNNNNDHHERTTMETTEQQQQQQQQQHIDTNSCNNNNNTNVDNSGETSLTTDQYMKQVTQQMNQFYKDSKSKNGTTTTTQFYPRGLTNVHNSCYINACMQALVHIPSFYHLFKNCISLSFLSYLNENNQLMMINGEEEFGIGGDNVLKKSKKKKQKKAKKQQQQQLQLQMEKSNHFMLTRAMIQFVNEFSPLTVQSKKKSGVSSSSSLLKPLDSGSSFTPTALLEYMQSVNTDILRQGDQHDVHEFLQFLLHQLHDELKLSCNHESEENAFKYAEQDDEMEKNGNDEGEWQEVGENNKANVVQEVRHEESPISDLFAGKMRSVIRKRSSVGSLILQPFYSLHLPIDNDGSAVTSIEDSLRLITAREQLDHLASMQIAVEQVPRVLVLQIIRFEYQDNRCIKIGKHVKFSEELYLDKNVISSIKIKEKDPSRYFNLRAVICHHGMEASGGHYSTYVKHASGRWIHFDDQMVNLVDLKEVLASQAYVLLYERRS